MSDFRTRSCRIPGARPVFVPEHRNFCQRGFAVRPSRMTVRGCIADGFFSLPVSLCEENVTGRLFRTDSSSWSGMLPRTRDGFLEAKSQERSVIKCSVR